jgi:DNA polymerase-4
MAERTILHLDMNAFFASVEQQANPWLRGKPVFVCGNRHSRTVVATASYEARAFGVATGMPLREALALCPHAILVEGNPAKYADCFRRVAQLMERYSPDLEVFSIDEAFLDVTATAARFGGALAIAHALHAEIQASLGLPCSIGIGPNKLLAKLASSMKKPNGITQIHPNEVTRVLAELPIEELCGIGVALQAHLNAQGITTCGELARVPVERLIAQFGRSTGLQLARLARGLDERPIVRVEEAPAAKSMGHLHTLSHDTTDPEVLRAVLLDLSEKVGRRLRAEGAAGRTVTVTVRLRDFTTHTHAWTLDEFLDDGLAIFQTGWRILERLSLTQPVRLLGICVSSLSSGLHQTWWLPEVRRRQRLVVACDRLNDRFGEATVSSASCWRAEAAGRHYQLKRYTTHTLLRDRS